MDNGEQELIRSLVAFDDGRDHTARLVWLQGERRRISEGVYSLPPPCPQVAKQSIKPKKKASRRRKKMVVGTDF